MLGVNACLVMIDVTDSLMPMGPTQGVPWREPKPAEARGEATASEATSDASIATAAARITAERVARHGLPHDLIETCDLLRSPSFFCR